MEDLWSPLDVFLTTIRVKVVEKSKAPKGPPECLALFDNNEPQSSTREPARANKSHQVVVWTNSEMIFINFEGIFDSPSATICGMHRDEAKADR